MKMNTVLVLALLCIPPMAAHSADWPMWRYDASRSAVSPETLESNPQLLWTKEFGAREPVWEDTLNRDLMPYDRVFEPVVMGNRLFLGFNDADKVVALDLDTGNQLWAFYADGPVRFPPVAANGKVYFVSDDGNLYCLDAETGGLVWRVAGAPKERLILGNRRVISTWPARGGPVLASGLDADKRPTVYWAAGIWPFMGTFIYATDAETGETIWLNDSDGPTYQEQPHGGAFAFGGVGPQGAFVVADEKLLIPGGRSVPAAFDRASGELIHYRFHDNNKTGGSFVCTDGEVFFNHHRDRITRLYDVDSGDELAGQLGMYPVVTPEAYYMSGEAITALDAGKVKSDPKDWSKAVLWKVETDATGDLILAGNRLYAAGQGGIRAFDLKSGDEPPAPAWEAALEGRVERLVAANGRLVAVTLDGRVMVFGPEGTEAPVTQPAKPAELPADALADAKAILEQAGLREGYALVYGDKEGKLLEALAVASDFHIVGLCGDGEAVDAQRRRLDALGLYGKRAAVREGEVGVNVAPYLASLTVVAQTAAPFDQKALESVFASMRPYGGRALVRGVPQEQLVELVKRAALPGLEVGEGGWLTREGALPGSAQWTHLLGDIAQTGKSDDELVRLPLGMLWFGGNTHEDVLVRHGHGPTEQVVGGRLVIEGMGCMSARDVYTGRVLWKTEMEELDTFGVYYDETYFFDPTNPSYNQIHIPGANIRGTNYVVTEDRVYIAVDGKAIMLDPANGERVGAILLPSGKSDRPEPWSYIGVYEDLLIGGEGQVALNEMGPPKPEREKDAVWFEFDISSSRRLVIMDRHSGEVKWQRDSKLAFLNNGIAAGKDLLFVLDKYPPMIEDQLKRRGKDPEGASRLMALDIRTGEVKWETTEGVFGSFLCYSDEYDILVQSTRPSRDTIRGEDGKRMIAYRGTDGTVLWDNDRRYATFPLLHGDTIITESGMFNLFDGKDALITDPVTGGQREWEWKRMYGCNHPIASEHLLTFRSGAAGFYDLSNAGGTGNFGGFKSGCSASLVAADGVLNAPDYTRTCSCSYQNQTSLALVHMPDVEMWTYNYFRWEDDEPVQALGINLGAPGDRLDGDLMWFNFPEGASPSPNLPVKSAPSKPSGFLHHSSRYEGERTWVGASGIEGIEELEIDLGPKVRWSNKYTVRLYFAEPDDVAEGVRVFTVRVQGDRVLEGFDVVREAGGPRRVIVAEVEKVKVKKDLAIELEPAKDSKLPPILCGVEILAK